MGNLDFSNTQALHVWVPGAKAGYVLAQQGVLCIQAPGKLFSGAFGHISLCYLDDSTVNFPLQVNVSWGKEGIKKALMGLTLAIKNVFS